MSRPSIWCLLAALVVPAIFLTTAYFVGHGQDLYEADPDHAYLFNALNLLHLRRSGMWPHPGATVQIVGGITIVLTWVLTLGQHGFRSISEAVVAAPEFYLRCIDAVMVAMDAVALIVLFVRVRSATKSCFPAVIGGATVLVSVPAFLSLHRVNPEPLLLSSAITLAAILAPVALSGVDPKHKSNYPLAMGLVFGFSLATKVTSAPLLLFTFLLPNRSHQMRALRATAITALIFTTPVFRNYLDMVGWYSGLLTHKQDYGAGEIGVQSSSQIANNLKTLFLLSPETFFFPALYVLVLALRRMGLQMPATAARALWVCILVTVVDIVLVAKQPQARYLISTVASLCLGNVIVSYYVLAMMRRAKAWAGATLATIFVAVGVTAQVKAANADALEQLDNRKLVARAEREDCVLVYYYEVKAVPYMLFFANAWSGDRYAPELQRVYPKAVFFNNATGRFQNFEGDISPQIMTARTASAKCIHLIGSPLERFGPGHFGMPDRYLTTIARTPGAKAKALSLLRLDPSFFRETGTP